jgi:tetratricopeptide (TPR) repeat protein
MDIESLIERASSALEAGDDKKALAAGQELLELRHTYGFEVLARAYWLREEKTRAIATLQEGTARAPHAWTLWELLAEYWGELGDPKRARECHEQILTIPTADTVSRAHALIELWRPDEAIAIAQAALAGNPDEETSARLHASIAHALLSKDDRDGALASAWDAIRASPSEEDAMWIIREMEQRHSETARQFRLIVRGVSADEGSFFASYVVVADDEDEAKELVARFEAEEVRASLAFDEIDSMDEAGDLPKGVYWRSGTVFYDESGA